MSSRSLREDPESTGDAPSFTCEVCKISVRSAQKLLDHVNFSPLHKAALEGGGLGGPHSPTKGRSGQRRILYDGTKLFWRINETLELCIYEDTGAANCITVTAAPQQPPSQDAPSVKVASLMLDRRSVIRAATEDAKLPLAAAHGGKAPAPPTSGHHGHTLHNQGHSHSQSHVARVVPPEVVTKYLLARLQAKHNGSSLALLLQKLKDDELEPTVLSQAHQLAMPLTDVAMRRRHTYDEVKTAQKEVNEAAVELKKARVQAENLSNLARLTLDVFSKRATVPTHGSPARHHSVSHASSGDGNKSEWLRVYDRVQFKNAVEHSKDVLLGRDQPYGSAATTSKEPQT